MSESLDGVHATSTPNFSSSDFNSTNFVRDMMLRTTTATTATPSMVDKNRTATSTRHLMKKTTEVENFLQDIKLQIGRVNKSIHQHVTHNQDFLMQRLSNVSLLFSDVKQVRAGVSLLQTSTGRVRRELLTPLEDMRSESRHLSRVQRASMLLRRSTRLLRLLRSLRVEIQKFEDVEMVDEGRRIVEKKQEGGVGERTEEEEEERRRRETKDTTSMERKMMPTKSKDADLPKVASLVREAELMLENDQGEKKGIIIIETLIVSDILFTF